MIFTLAKRIYIRFQSTYYSYHVLVQHAGCRTICGSLSQIFDTPGHERGWTRLPFIEVRRRIDICHFRTGHGNQMGGEWTSSSATVRAVPACFCNNGTKVSFLLFHNIRMGYREKLFVHVRHSMRTYRSRMNLPSLYFWLFSKASSCGNVRTQVHITRIRTSMSPSSSPNRTWDICIVYQVVAPAKRSRLVKAYQREGAAYIFPADDLHARLAVNISDGV